MTEGTTNEAPRLSNDQINDMLQQFAARFSLPLRSPVLHSRPNLDYEDVTIPPLNGLPLEGRFIPAVGFNKLIIANHPMGFSRSELPTQFEL
jgi:hypothetical protein